MIKRSFLTDTTFTALFIFTIYLFAQINESPIHVAVLDFEGNGVTEAEAKTLTDKLRGELITIGHFQIIEFSHMKQVLKKQGFKRRGRNASECAVEAGQLLGVKRIITGNIGRTDKNYKISAQIINVGSGEVAKTVKENMHGKTDVLLNKGIKQIALKLSKESDQRMNTREKVKKLFIKQ